MSTCLIRAVLCLVIVIVILLVHANAMILENPDARPKAKGMAAIDDFADFDEEVVEDSNTNRVTVHFVTQGLTSAAFPMSTTGSRTTNVYATSTTAPSAASTKAGIISTGSSTSTTKPSIQTPETRSRDSDPDPSGDFDVPPAGESSPAKTSASTSTIVTTQVLSPTLTSTENQRASAATIATTTKASPKPSTTVTTASSKSASSAKADLPDDPDDPYRNSDHPSVPPTLPPTRSQTAATTKRHQSASGHSGGRTGVIQITASTPKVQAVTTASERPTLVSSSDSATKDPGRERIPLDEGRSGDRQASIKAAGLGTEPEMFTWLMLLLLLILSTVAWIWFCCVK